MKTPEPTSRRVVYFLSKFTLGYVSRVRRRVTLMTPRDYRKGFGSVIFSLLVFAGCLPTTARFVQTEPDLTPRPRRVAPRIVWDLKELKSPAMISIGIVHVTGMTSATLRDSFQGAVP